MMKEHKPPYVLGIDSGTHSLRSGIFDLEGRPVVFATWEYPVYHPKPGWAEQEPNDWWEAIVSAVRECLARRGVRPEDILGLSLDNTSCTMLPVGQDGRPLRRALLWMDVRAHDQARRITATHDPILKYVGNIESPEWMLPKALWIKENEPGIYREADKIVESLDWLTYRLTGRWVASINNVTCKWNYARPEGGWSRKLLEDVGLSELPGKWPSEILPVGEEVGPLLPEVAEELGLAPGTPVIEGCIDAYAGMIGLNVVRPGRLALITGSSTCHLAVSAEGVFGSMAWGPYPDAVIPGLWVLEGGQVSTGSIVKWFADNFAHREQLEAEERGISVYEILDEKASEVRPGSEGLVLLDYWQGNRSPLRDPLARGVIWGLSLNHGVGHLFRAIYEGTAYGTRHILEDMARAGFRVREMYACGGGTRSALWMQIHADVCQVPIYLTEVQEATTLGSAICAAVGTGQYRNLQEAAEAMVRVTRRIDPDLTKKETYDFYFRNYVATYPGLKDLLHRVTTRVESGG